MWARNIAIAMMVLVFAAIASAGSTAIASMTSHGVVIPRNSCIVVVPADGGEELYCRFFRPTKLYLVSKGGSHHRFRYNLVCGQHRMDNLRPDSGGGDSFWLIPNNNRQRLPWKNSEVVNALRHASRARPCTLSATFTKWPESDYYDSKINFISVYESFLPG